MASGDWIKLYRKLLYSPIMKHDGLFRLFVYCLLRANWKDAEVHLPGTTKPQKVLRGQFITGRFALHSDLYSGKRKSVPSPSTVWRWLHTLERDGCISVTNLNNVASIVTVIKYDTYQNGESEDEQPVNNLRTTCGQPADNLRTTDEQPVDTEEERKKEIRQTNKEDVAAAAVGECGGKFDDTARFEAMAYGHVIFRERLDSIVNSYPDPIVPKYAFEAWFEVARTISVVEQIERSLPAWKATDKWVRRIGIPSFSTWMKDGWWMIIPGSAAKDPTPAELASARRERAQQAALRGKDPV